MIPGIGEILGSASDKAGEMLGGLTSVVPGIQSITKERLFYEMETKGTLRDLQNTLRDLQKEIVASQAQSKRQRLFSEILGRDANPLARSVVELLEQDKLSDAEARVREEMDKNPKETKKIIEHYNLKPSEILRRVQAGEIEPEEGKVLAQQAFLNHPLIVKAQQETGFEAGTLAAAAAGFFVDRGKMPQNPKDILLSLMSSASGLMHFRVVKRASEKLGIEESSIRAVYGMKASEFPQLVDNLKSRFGDTFLTGSLSEDVQKRLKDYIKDKASTSEERRIINFILKDPKNGGEIQKVYEYVSNKENVEKALQEIDKTYQKIAEKTEQKVSANAIRQQSIQRFQSKTTIGQMLKYRYQLREDNNTLMSYTLANIFGTLPRAFTANLNLRSMQGLFSKISTDKAFRESFTKRMEGSWLLGRGKTLRMAADVEKKMKSEGFGKQASAEIAASTDDLQKAARRGSVIGKVRWAIGPAALAASEVYNVYKGNTTVDQAAFGFLGGVLHFVPIAGTYLDFRSAITGEDVLTGRKLTKSEIMSLYAWGAVGAITDLTMVIPFLGIPLKSVLMTAKGANIARKSISGIRTVGMGAGLGFGLAPLVGTSEGREAIVGAGTVAAGATNALAATFRMMSAPGGGTADMDIMMDDLKDKGIDIMGTTVDKVQETASAVGDRVQGFMDKHNITPTSWGAEAIQRSRDYFKDPTNLSQLDDLKGVLDRDSNKARELKDIFANGGLSVRERHRRISEFIETNRSGREH